MTPRALSSFIAISLANRQNPARVRARTLLFATSAVCWFFAVLPDPFRFFSFGMACLTTLLLLLEKSFQGDDSAFETLSPDAQRVVLLEKLNRHRATVGLQSVIAEGPLTVLEENAMQWEKIESMLSTSVWQGQVELRTRVLHTADEYMNQMVMRYEGRTHGLEEYSGRLHELARALEAVDKTNFIYPRESGLEPVIDLPKGDAMRDLEAALVY
jgi:hypothetical protein